MRRPPQRLPSCVALLPVFLLVACTRPQSQPAQTAMPVTTTLPPVPIEQRLQAVLDAEGAGYRQCLDAAAVKYPYQKEKKAEAGKPKSVEEATRRYEEARANADRVLKRMEAERKCYEGFVAQVNPKMAAAGATPEQAEAALTPWVKDFLNKK